MDKIVIAKGASSVEMPRVRAVTVGGEEVAKQIITAGGKIVKEMIGHRAVVTAEWDWVPAESIVALHTLLRLGGFFTVSYPDPDGTYKTETFSVSYPTTKIFKFIGTAARWHGVSLTMTAQEVV